MIFLDFQYPLVESMPKAASVGQKGNSKVCMSISGHTDLRDLDVDLFEVSNQLRQNLSYTGHVKHSFNIVLDFQRQLQVKYMKVEKKIY